MGVAPGEGHDIVQVARPVDVDAAHAVLAYAAQVMHVCHLLLHIPLWSSSALFEEVRQLTSHDNMHNKSPTHLLPLVITMSRQHANPKP